ncbi:MAG: ABC transporter permease subunit [Deltaproteobacteria bacterium]|nr:ABC transporter permease subunit [Deltaproteobacteria bacterium]
MNVLHIAAREFRSTFGNPVGWLVLCGFLMLTGVFWYAQLDFYVTESANLVFNPYGAPTMTLAGYLLGPFFGNTLVVVLMVMPAVTMRLFAEEIRGRTLELLLTSPVSTLEIVLGKFLGALAFVTLMLAATAYAPLSLLVWTDTLDWGVVGGGYLALFLVSCALLSLGMFASSITNSQMVALVLAFSGSLALYVLSWLGDGPDAWQTQLSVGAHVEDLLRGALRLSDLTYYAAFVGFFLFATHQRLESFRWR